MARLWDGTLFDQFLERLSPVQARTLEQVWTLTPPDGWDGGLEILPRWTSSGWTGSVDASSFRPDITGKATYYVDIQTGTVGGAGTEADPMSRISTALKAPNMGRVMIAPGLYPHYNSWANATDQNSGLPVDLEYIVEPWRIRQGKVIITSGESSYHWVRTAGTDVWSTTVHTASHAVDLLRTNAWGTPARYLIINADGSMTEAQALSSVAATPGSSTVIGAGASAKLHVHCSDSREPDAFLLGLQGRNCAVEAGSQRHCFMRGLTFIDGQGASFKVLAGSNTTGQRLTAINCSFHAGDRVGLQTFGAARVITQDCVSNQCGSDAFHYTLQSGRPSLHCYEIRGRSFGSGVDNTAGTQGNSFTTHPGSQVIRIGCVGGFNYGPTFADVDVGNQSWNVGCKSIGNALPLGSNFQNTGFQSVGTADSWNHECVSVNSEYAFVAAIGAKVYLSNCEGDTYGEPNGGVIGKYEQLR